MTWLEISIIGNIILAIIIGIFTIDRIWFIRSCKLRHNPIDEAIKEIKGDIRRIWDFLNEKL